MSDYRALGTDTIQPILTFRFSVALDGIGEFEATEVSGLGYEIEMIEDEIVGPSGSASLRKMPAISTTTRSRSPVHSRVTPRSGIG